MALEEDPEDTPSSRPRARNKRAWASVERDPGKVTEELFEEAHRRDPEQKHQWVMRVDGIRINSSTSGPISSILV
jgi:hypothetical protein